MTRKPSHPGEMLRKGYLEPLLLSPENLALKLKIPAKELNDFIEEKCRLSIDLAMRLAYAFGTTPEFWLNAQRNLDIWQAYQGQQAWREAERIYSPSDKLEAI